MGWLGVVLILYALLNIGGGIAGYLSSAHSVPSVISGSAAGILVIGAAALATSHPKLGYIIAGVIALADLGFFAMKLSKGAGIWPAGVMAASSAIVLICIIAGLATAKAAS